MRFAFDERIEIITGHIFRMSPAQIDIIKKHLEEFISHCIFFLDGIKCEVYGAPFDVRLPKKSKEDAAIFTVILPYVVVVCEPSKPDKRGCVGASDIVLEILSPDNNEKELQNKYEVY